MNYGIEELNDLIQERAIKDGKVCHESIEGVLLDPVGFFSLTSVLVGILMDMEWDRICGWESEGLPFIYASYLDCFDKSGFLIKEFHPNSESPFIGLPPSPGEKIICVQTTDRHPSYLLRRDRLLEKQGCELITTIILIKTLYIYELNNLNNTYIYELNKLI
jgi:hypothetical protein